MNRTLAVVLGVIGLWLFLAPFLGPVIGLPIVPAMSSSMMHMGMRMGNMPTVTVNRAMVFFNFIPGIILMLVSLYYLFERRPERAIA